MIELRVLGPTSLKRADGSTVGSLLAQPKRLALAAYLAAPPPHGGRCFHRKDTLVATFWPELDQHHARAALRNAIYFLRTHLGQHAVRTGDDDAVGLDPEAVWCDLDAFDVAVRMRDHSRAHQLYRGALLEGVYVHDAPPFEEWLDAQRERRAVEVRSAAAQAARRHAAAGRLEEALVWAARARALAPLNEDAARLLIALRYLTGDRAGAFDEYNRLESALDVEHGVAPSSDTRRLIQAVRDADLDAASVAEAIAQVPLPIAARLGHEPAGPQRFRLHDRTVCEALVQVRVSLARRRGDRVGLVLVRLGASPTDAATDKKSRLHLLADLVMGGVRGSDLVTSVDPDTLALLPAEDGAVDVTALVGRLSRHLQRRNAAAPGHTAHATRIDTIWIDPVSTRTVAELLDEALLPA